MPQGRTIELGENVTVHLTNGESVEIPAWVIQRIKIVTEVYEPPFSGRNLIYKQDLYAELKLRFPIDQYTLDMNVDKPYEIGIETEYVKHLF